MIVPIDYADPSQGTTAIALAKRAATGQKRGTLFVNPGGPGRSGIQYLEYFPEVPALNAIYDIVGFDPRGVGQSDPLGCLDAAGEDALIAANLDPRHPEDLQQSIVLLREEGEACLRTNPRLARHVTTVETAKDLDVLRAVVGDDSLNYFGASYGTYLGATYAALFPERVGRLVLDGAVDPSLTPEQEALNAAKGFQTAFEAFADDCLAAPPCALGSSRDEIVTKVSDLITGLHAQPLKTDDPERPLTQWLGYLGIIAPLYAESVWPELNRALVLAFDGFGTALLDLADWLMARTADGYSTNAVDASFAINCLDYPLKPSGPPPAESEFLEASPVFGQMLYGTALAGCDGWPITPTVPAPDYSTPAAAPILVVGTTRDPATPYANAQKLAELLPTGVLLTRDGDGHTAYGQGNDCIDDAIDAFLIDGTIPADGATCPAG